MKQYYMGDFGEKDELGAWYNPISWFGEKKFTKEQNRFAGEKWLKEVYNESRTSYTYPQMVQQLNLSHYGEVIAQEDYDGFLESIGYSVNVNKAISDKVKASLVKVLSASRNKFPDRRQVSSAFLNPDNVKWTLMDAVSQTAKQSVAQVQSTVKSVASIVGVGASTLQFIFKYKWLIVGVAAAGASYFLYKNRKEVGARIKERAFQKIGLGIKSNPHPGEKSQESMNYKKSSKRHKRRK